MNTKLAQAKANLDYWTTEIVQGNISIYTLNRLAEAQGQMFEVEIADDLSDERHQTVSTVAEELTKTKENIATLVAEIAQGKFNTHSLNQLAVARGNLFVLEVLSLSWESEKERRASAERWIVEATRKSTEPGVGSFLYKAEVVAFNRYLSGQLVLN